MTDHHIQRFQQLLKRLEDEIYFLTSLINQTNGLQDQVTFMSLNLKNTWIELDRNHKSWKSHVGRGKKKYFH